MIWVVPATRCRLSLMLLLLLIATLPCLPAGLELPAFKTAAQMLLSEIILKAPATRDVYHTLSSKQKAAWTYGEARSINDTIAAMTSVPINLVVDVRLVGMQGDGTSQLHIVASQLERYLVALHGEMDTVALQPELRRLLPLQPKITFRVSHAPENIREGVHSAIERSFKDSREHPDDSVYSPYVMVPYRHVDAMIDSDWRVYHASLRKANALSTFTLYLLTPAHFDEHYGYSYDPEDKAKAKQQSGDMHHPGLDGSCPGTLWAGGRPYAWIDLAAGPIVYGPGLGHQGQVLAHSLPRPDTYVSIPLANTAILPDLAALAWSACKHLVWPPLHHAELQFREEVVIQIVHMHDTLLPPDRHIDKNRLFDQLHSAVPQIVDVQEKFVSFANCDVCVAAFTGSTKIRTSSDGGGQVQAQSRPFLDRLVLHHMMRRFKDKIFGYADIRDDESSTGTKRHILPVFVFDLSQDVVLLLDDESRSAAFPDMVLAVATKGGEPLRTHFSCFYQRVLLDGKDITREVMASVLQSGWGVAHTASYHSHATGENANYLWSVGNTPFGPFSQLASLSATQTHVAQRNHIVVLLDDAARRIRDVMQGFGQLCVKGHVECVLDSVLKTKLVRRLNMFEWKAWQAADHLADWDAHAALPYARSAMHDAAAIELLAVHGSSGRVEAAIKCEGHIEAWHFYVYPALAMLSWLAAMALRLRVSRPKLNKQY